VGALHLRRPLTDVAALAHTQARPELVAHVLGNGVLAHQSVPAAITAWLAHVDQPLHALRFAIALGGDTDTIASMTGALAGARSGSGGWPHQLLARLEDVDRITHLATALTHRLLPAGSPPGPTPAHPSPPAIGDRRQPSRSTSDEESRRGQ
jgi:hypothetical protein